MKIFEKRPLSLILCIMLGGFSLFALSDVVLRGILIIVAALALTVTLAVKSLRDKIMPKLCLSLLLVSFLVSFFYFDMYFYSTPENGSSVRVEGVVEDIEVKSYVKVLEVKSESIDDVHNSSKLIVYCYDMDTFIPVGSRVEFYSEIKKIESGEDFDFSKFYASEGISASCECEKITIIEGGNEPLSYKLKRFRLEISSYIEELTSKDSGGLLSALLLGEKELMDSSLKLNFERMGISHILALSGLHIAILVAAIGFILKLFGIDKRINIIVCIIFCLGFMALTGFPTSVCRAGLMLIVSSVLYLITGCKDNITSLSVAVLIIVALEPYSVFDMGLWLSALATFGILVYSEMHVGEYDTSPLYLRVLKWILASLFVSLFAISATSVISAFAFTGISTISVFTTLVFGLLSQWYIYLGLIILAIGSLVPIGGILVWFYELIYAFSTAVSSLPFVFYSSNFTVVKIFAVITAALCFAFAIFKIEKKKIFISVLALSLFITYAAAGTFTEANKYGDNVLYSENDGDRLLVNSEGKTTLIEISDYKVRDAYNSVAFLESCSVATLDTYLVLGYNYNYLDSLEIMFGEIRVKDIRLPIPLTEKELDIADSIYDICEENSVNLKFYDFEDGFKSGCMKILPAFRSCYGEGALVCGFIIRDGDSIYSYVSRGAFAHSDFAEELLYVSEGLIIGSYGRSYTKTVTISEKTARLKTLIVNDKDIVIDEELRHADDLNIELYKKSCYLIR